MSELPFYKQSTVATCGFACLRMVIASFGKFISEYELAKIVNFDPDEGVSPRMLVDICEILNLDYDYLFKVNFESLKEIVNKKLCPIVLVNPGLLYGSFRTEHNHYIIVKNITNEKIIINDPDQEFGGENKIIEIIKFKKAFGTANGIVIVIEGENL